MAAIVAAIGWLVIGLAGVGLNVWWVVTEEDSRLLLRDITFGAPAAVISLLMLVFAVRVLAGRARGVVAAGVISVVGGLAIFGASLLIDSDIHFVLGIALFAVGIVGLAGSGAYAKRHAA